ncbi:hypothetical protein IQ31_05460 [Sphingobacterium siyangense]|jgi:hypothetical protein|uniref:Uncharacterized protein n=2 Tax=Sphingobacterium siyangense TaxID=459529 RepID=A0A562M2S8_9SPHI|nr:hypothetical protein IQ31_05460 [Sphingobacterium siyangense]
MWWIRWRSYFCWNKGLHDYYVYREFFSYDPQLYKNNGYGKNLDAWWGLSSHEVGYLPQVEKHDGLISYFGEFAKQYTNNGHDDEYEKEAEKGAVNFKNFNDFVNKKIGKNAITELLSGGLSEENKIDKLQAWINYFNSSTKKKDDDEDK